MDHPLEAIDWRIKRADKHLAALDRERDTIIDEENRCIIGQFERDTSEYVFRFKGKLPNPRLGIIVGEFGHHLRSALDNLVWQLVRLRGGSPTRRNEFPIEERRKGYKRKLGRGALRGVSADDRAAIKRVQPYHGGERASQSYLALLSWLNNVDKHRFVHVIGGAIPSRFPIRVSYGAKGQDAGLFPWNPLIVKDVDEILYVDYVSSVASHDRTELMRVGIRAGADPEMKVRGDAPVEIGLSDPKHALTINDLKIIRNWVVGIVDGFRPRFVGRLP